MKSYGGMKSCAPPLPRSRATSAGHRSDSYRAAARSGLSELAENEREAQALQLPRKRCNGPSNLTIGPLLRVTIVRLGNNEHAVCGQYTIFSTTAGPLGSSSGS